MADVIGAIEPEHVGRRVRSNELLYAEIADFLIDEALLLDHNRYNDWQALLAEDLVYRMPVRQTVRAERGLGFDRSMAHFDDDYGSIMLRVKRLNTGSAYAEEPPTRLRRCVSNVRVNELHTEGEFAVTSYLLALRSRSDASDFEIISCQRNDVLRRHEGSFRIARRIMYLDQAVFGSANLAIFL